MSDCALGHELILKKHRYWVRYNKRTFRGLPKGGHGKLEIKIGTIEQMVTYLMIDVSCAKKYIPGLTLSPP